MESLHLCERKIPTRAKRNQLLGSAAPLSMERSPLILASAGSHVLSPVCQDDLPHITLLLTARPGGPETHCDLCRDTLI